MVRVLFVCLGNICRSPMAEAIFRHIVEEEGLADRFEIDSAGTSDYHIGEPPYPGTQRILKKHGIEYEGRARQVTIRDLDYYDYVIAMDRSNLADLKIMLRGRKPRAKIALLTDFAPELGLRDVPDPYTDDPDDPIADALFERTYNIIRAGVEGLLRHIADEEGLRK